MVDIFDIPVYYISFEPVPDLVEELKQVGFNEIHHFKAIDGRKLDPSDLLEQGLITIRSYDDLMTRRSQNSGLPTTGAVGCTMSHSALWNLCVELNLPYIAIAEGDLAIRPIDDADKKRIESILSKPKSVFVSSDPTRFEDNAGTVFIGLHFYIASREACRILAEKTFPIDVQTDFYVSHMGAKKKVNLEGFDVGKWKQHQSTIQETFCVKCRLPNSTYTYIFVGLGVFVIILSLLMSLFIVSWKFSHCKRELKAYQVGS